jgi:hypothetical protein
MTKLIPKVMRKYLDFFIELLALIFDPGFKGVGGKETEPKKFFLISFDEIREDSAIDLLQIFDAEDLGYCDNRVNLLKKEITQN